MLDNRDIAEISVGNGAIIWSGEDLLLHQQCTYGRVKIEIQVNFAKKRLFPLKYFLLRKQNLHDGKTQHKQEVKKHQNPPSSSLI